MNNTSIAHSTVPPADNLYSAGARHSTHTNFAPRQDDSPDTPHTSGPTVPHSRTLTASFGHAFTGLWYAIRTQRNMRIHLSVSVAVIGLGLYLGLGWSQWAVLALTMGFVFVAEMFNTVAEAVMDVAAPYYHPLVRIAKDVAAGAVLVTALASVSVGLLVMGPPLWSRLSGWLGH
jgi:diacylglycerol kinase (ATP)